MKIPSKIFVCGVNYTVKKDPGCVGGSFDTEKAFLHEVIELVYATRNMRYIRQVPEQDNGDYIFHYSHEEHYHAIADIAAALKGIRF